MAIFIQIVIMLVLAYVSYKLTPKAKNNNAAAKPADLNTPTVSPGRPLPVLFGRMRMQDPNDLWHGDRKNAPIRK